MSQKTAVLNPKQVDVRRMKSSRMLRRVAVVRTDVSEELSASIRGTGIGELGTTLGVTSESVANYS
jgi:hypothetical protein